MCSSDGARGELDAEMTLSGLVGVAGSRRGRGTVHVGGEGVRVINMPLVVRLVEVSNLQLPSNDRLDFAQAAFYIEGGRVCFEDLAIFSKAVAIMGYGTMDWPDTRLDLRFNSRSARPIPVLSWVVQGIRDEIVSTSVTGTLGRPKVELRQFAGTRRMLSRALGEGDTDQSRHLAELERRAGARSALRPSARGAVGPRTTSAGDDPAGREPPQP